MNIFFVDRDARIAATMLCDKHVIKMRLETAQLMTSVWERQQDRRPYHGLLVRLPLHAMNHPCALWAQSNALHYHWLFTHFEELCEEKSMRWPHGYNRIRSMRSEYCNAPRTMPVTDWVDPPLVMPDECKLPEGTTNRTVLSYQKYYREKKMHLCTYTERDPPLWLNESSGA